MRQGESLKARVTSRGRVTIPKEVREGLGLRPGDRVDLIEDGTGGLRIRKILGNEPLSAESSSEVD